MSDICATCAKPYASPLEPLSEKPLLPGRYLECCGRSICSRCLNQNKRYETYCPYCQISSGSSVLPQGLRDPPAYSAIDGGTPSTNSNTTAQDDGLPAYSEYQAVQPPPEKASANDPAPDVLHFLTPADTMHSLALAYCVPIDALRRTNKVFADHLIQGRKTVLIPGEYYKGGVSLSPQPIEGEEEEIKRNKTRRWMVACKVAEYDVALLYLKQAQWNLTAAIEAYQEDERWEKAHPLESQRQSKNGKNPKDVGMRRFVGASSHNDCRHG